MSASNKWSSIQDKEGLWQRSRYVFINSEALCKSTHLIAKPDDTTMLFRPWKTIWSKALLLLLLDLILYHFLYRLLHEFFLTLGSPLSRAFVRLLFLAWHSELITLPVLCFLGHPLNSYAQGSLHDLIPPSLSKLTSPPPSAKTSRLARVACYLIRSSPLQGHPAKCLPYSYLPVKGSTLGGAWEMI